MDFFLSVFLLAAVGFLIGIFSGLLGIGGGTVMVPAFRLIFGMSALASTATSLFVIIPTSLSGAITRIHQKTCIFSLGVAAGLGGALTSALGVWLAAHSPSWLVMVVAAAVIAYSALNMFTKAFKLKGEGAVAGLDGESAVGDAGTGESAAGVAGAGDGVTKKQLLWGFAIGFVAGLVAGYVGVGGGFLMIPLMISILGLSMKDASGTSLVAMIILVIPAVIEQAFLGNIDFIAGVVVVAGSVPGAIVGAHFVKRIPERALRFVFSGFLLVAAALLALNELSLFG